MVSSLTVVLLAIGSIASGLLLVSIQAFGWRPITFGEYLNQRNIDNSLSGMRREVAMIAPVAVFVVFTVTVIAALLFNAGVPLDPYQNGSVDLSGLVTR